MGLLRTILTYLAGALTGPAAGKLLEEVISMLNNPQTGGLSGLVKAFQDKGLDQIISSWISTGKNLPVSRGQIQEVLGPDKIQQMSQSLGVSNRQVSATLAKLLPELIDKLTPDGNLPEEEALPQRLAGLKQKLVV